MSTTNAHHPDQRSRPRLRRAPGRARRGRRRHQPFQRLRYVRQLSATHLVYPGANHTRFEHSLGVYHLGRTVFENLRQQSYFAREATVDELEEIQRTLECACLLHDVGHPPFSHLSEGFLDEGYSGSASRRRA